MLFCFIKAISMIGSTGLFLFKNLEGLSGYLANVLLLKVFDYEVAKVFLTLKWLFSSSFNF